MVLFEPFYCINSSMKKVTQSKYSIQKLESLALDKEFQNDILTIRKEWLIPQNGLGDSYDTYVQWYEDIERRSKLYRRTKEYRIKQEISPVLFGLPVEVMSRYGIEKDLAKFYYGVIPELLEKYELSNHYNEAIKNYIKHNDFRYERTINSYNFEIISQRPIRVRDSQTWTKPTLLIKIFPDTTKTDLWNAWPQIEKEREKLFGSKEKTRKRSSYLFERNKIIFSLAQKEMPRKNIAIEIKKMYGGKILGYDEIGKIIMRFKNKTKSNTKDT
jgi:hypothetical protein